MDNNARKEVLENGIQFVMAAQVKYLRSRKEDVRIDTANQIIRTLDDCILANADLIEDPIVEKRLRKMLVIWTLVIKKLDERQ